MHTYLLGNNAGMTYFTVERIKLFPLEELLLQVSISQNVLTQSVGVSLQIKQSKQNYSLVRRKSESKASLDTTFSCSLYAAGFYKRRTLKRKFSWGVLRLPTATLCKEGVEHVHY